MSRGGGAPPPGERGRRPRLGWFCGRGEGRGIAVASAVLDAEVRETCSLEVPPHLRGDPGPLLVTDSIGTACEKTSSPIKTICWPWEEGGENDAKKAVEAERKAQAQ